MRNDIVFMTAITPDYEGVEKRLIASFEKFDLPFGLWKYPDQGTWMENAHFRTEILRQALNHYSGTFNKYERPFGAIVWIDADAEILKYPEKLFNIEADFACRLRGINYNDMTKNELMSGTMFIRNNEHGKRLIALWKKANELNPDRRSQRNLQSVLFSHQHEPEWKWSGTLQVLPNSYTHVFDEPVIIHYQESRRAKKRRPQK